MATPLLSPALAPPGVPQRVGGLLAASQPGDENARWTSGVMTWYEAPPGWQLVWDCSDAVSEHGLPDELRPVAGRPVMIRASARGPRPEIDHMADRARHRAEAVTSRALARELWAGDLTRTDPYELPDRWDWTNPVLGDGYANPHFAAGGDDVGSVGDVLDAVAAVEQAVAEKLLVGVPHIHVPVAAMPALVDHVTPMGDLLTTTSGSVVVADYGYPADADTAVVYGTGPVAVWLGSVEVLDEPAEVVNTATNEIEVWAERPALALFDPATLVSARVAAT